MAGDSHKDSTGFAVQDQTGVVVGVLLGLTDDNMPLVAFLGSSDRQLEAKSTVLLRPSDIGSQVALVFENGQLDKPMVIGKILVPGVQEKVSDTSFTATVDEEVLTLKANRKIVLKCGKASITLTRAGKIIIHGAYVSSRSAGVNKIKGGSVQIN